MAIGNLLFLGVILLTRSSKRPRLSGSHTQEVGVPLGLCPKHRSGEGSGGGTGGELNNVRRELGLRWGSAPNPVHERGLGRDPPAGCVCVYSPKTGRSSNTTKAY